MSSAMILLLPETEGLVPRTCLYRYEGQDRNKVAWPFLRQLRSADIALSTDHAAPKQSNRHTTIQP